MPFTPIAQNAPPSTAESEETPQPIARLPIYRRFVAVYFVLLALLLLALIPPLVNVNRFKHRIVTSISTTLGRPVHLDNVALNLLPLPGFTLENFVVEEDPRFGSEPLIRAQSVRVTLRVSSLWRRKVEFATIALDEPSLNLVHTTESGQDRWNFESLLLQAAHISAAPTAQAKPGPTPRFPYIEATGARINIKTGDEKLPFALTDTDLSLWLPSPQQWHLRLVGHPTRTDTSASDTGTVELEGTLGRAPTFGQIPLDLTAAWKNAPLGEASVLLFGTDVGLRGDLAFYASVHGTLDASVLKTRAQLSDLRRADFVPQHPIDIEADCLANTADVFHAFHAIQCSWPSSGSAGNKLLAITGDLPDIHDPSSASFELGTPGLPADVLLNWLHVASARVPSGETATGTLTGKIARDPAPLNREGRQGAMAKQEGRWSGDLLLHGGSLSAPGLKTPVEFSDLSIVSANGTFLLAPSTLNLGGKDPAVLEGRFDGDGYTLHLSGTVVPARLLAFAQALPQFGDGLAALFPHSEATPETDGGTNPIHIDLTAAHDWRSSPQTRVWTRTTVPQHGTHPHSARAHRPVMQNPVSPNPAKP